MDDQTAEIIGVIVLILIAVVIFKGALKTFRRNWIAALLCLILLTPIWVIWAFVEVFTGEINRLPNQPASNNQSINLTLFNQADGTTRRMDLIQPDNYPKSFDARVVSEETIPSQPTISLTQEDTKECPFCAETVRRNAVVCRYCNRDI